MQRVFLSSLRGCVAGGEALRLLQGAFPVRIPNFPRNGCVGRKATLPGASTTQKSADKNVEPFSAVALVNEWIHQGVAFSFMPLAEMSPGEVTTTSSRADESAREVRRRAQKQNTFHGEEASTLHA